MSFFGGGKENNGPSALTIAKIETEVLTEMFNKMAMSCHKKCVFKTADGELNTGEMSCIDRCVGKYMGAHDKIGKVLNDFEKQLKMQENAGIAAPKPTGR